MAAPGTRLHAALHAGSAVDAILDDHRLPDDLFNKIIASGKDLRWRGANYIYLHTTVKRVFYGLHAVEFKVRNILAPGWFPSAPLVQQFRDSITQAFASFVTPTLYSSTRGELVVTFGTTTPRQAVSIPPAVTEAVNRVAQATGKEIVDDEQKWLEIKLRDPDIFGNHYAFTTTLDPGTPDSVDVRQSRVVMLIDPARVPTNKSSLLNVNRVTRERARSAPRD